MTNNTSTVGNDTWHDWYDVGQPIQRNMDFFLVIYVIFTIVAIVGNVVVAITVSFSSNMRSRTFNFILSLAFSDWLFAAISPAHVIVAILDQGNWSLVPLGDYGCKIYYFLFRWLYAYSVLILVVITLERFRGIVYPLKPRINTPTWVVICSTLVISAVFTSPYLEMTVLDLRFAPILYSCYNTWELSSLRVYTYTCNIVLYLFPLCLMLILYTMMWSALRRPPPGGIDLQRRMKRRKKMAFMMLGVVTGFFVSWTPWIVFEVYLMANYPPIWDNVMHRVYEYSTLIIFLSGALNPILYSFLSEEFRKSVMKVFCRPRRIRVGPEPSASNSTHMRQNQTTDSRMPVQGPFLVTPGE